MRKYQTIEFVKVSNKLTFSRYSNTELKQEYNIYLLNKIFY